MKTYKLWLRDGGACHLCGGLVPLDAPLDSPAKASQDHFVPQSEGGKSELNIFLAHRWCNSRRGDLPVSSINKDHMAKEFNSVYEYWLQKREEVYD